MLTITETAAEAIRGLTAAPDIPDGAGLRIATQPDSAMTGALEVSVVADPADSDQVVDEDGARVFVEERAVALLDDKQLDAHIEGERVGFLLTERPAA